MSPIAIQERIGTPAILGMYQRWLATTTALPFPDLVEDYIRVDNLAELFDPSRLHSFLKGVRNKLGAQESQAVAGPILQFLDFVRQISPRFLIYALPLLPPAHPLSPKKYQLLLTMKEDLMKEYPLSIIRPLLDQQYSWFTSGVPGWKRAYIELEDRLRRTPEPSDFLTQAFLDILGTFGPHNKLGRRKYLEMMAYFLEALASEAGWGKSRKERLINPLAEEARGSWASRHYLRKPVPPLLQDFFRHRERINKPLGPSPRYSLLATVELMAKVVPDASLENDLLDLLPFHITWITDYYYEQFSLSKIAGRTYVTKISLLGLLIKYLITQRKASAALLVPIMKANRPRSVTGKRDWSRKDVLAFIDAVYRGGSLRDMAILGLFLATGMRMISIIRLALSDVDFKTGTIRIIGKRGRVQVEPIEPELLNALKDYLNIRRQPLNPLEDAFFLSMVGTAISQGSLSIMFHRYYDGLGLRGVPAWHAFRHTFVTMMSEAGVSETDIATWLGHASLDSQTVYGSLTDHRVAREVKAKVWDRNAD